MKKFLMILMVGSIVQAMDRGRQSPSPVETVGYDSTHGDCLDLGESFRGTPETAPSRIGTNISLWRVEQYEAWLRASQSEIPESKPVMTVAETDFVRVWILCTHRFYYIPVEEISNLPDGHVVSKFQ